MTKSIDLYLLGLKGYSALQYIISSSNYLDLVNSVIIGTDAGVKTDFSNEISQLCKKSGIKYLFRGSTSNGFEEGDIIICIGWRWIVSSARDVIVLHDSMLPRYRGFAPLVSQLINKEPQLGVTAINAVQRYDQGDIICQFSVDIDYPLKIADAINIVGSCYNRCLEFIFSCLIKSEMLPSTPQNNSLATYSLWRDKGDYRIDWTRRSHDISRFVDAVGDPYAGAVSLMNQDPINIVSTIPVDDVWIENRVPGKVIFIDDGKPIIVCGHGLLKIIDAYDQNGISILPFRKIRTRFV